MIPVEMDMLTAAVAGDAAAVSAVLALLRPRVAAYLSRRVPIRADVGVEDVVQETLLAVARALPRFRLSSVDQFAGWVLAIARHKAIDAHRRAGWDVPVEDMPEVLTYLSPDRVVDDRATLAALADVLATLTPFQRACVGLRAAGLSSVEAGAVLGRQDVSVRVAHHRALAVLRAWRDAS